MYLRKCRKTLAGGEYVYWQLVEPHRTERGPRQRVVAYLGDMDEALRLGIAEAATGTNGVRQECLLPDGVTPEWVEVDLSRLRVERVLDFGTYWLGVQPMERLGLRELLDALLPAGREDVPWPAMAMVLVLMRLVDPASELHIAEGLFERSALGDLLAIPAEKVNDDRLYRALDRVLPHKESLEEHLKERLGRLFRLEYDLLLYDITSTYFEGTCEGNEEARFGYSRDKRSDCKQVCIGLVVSREGIPLGYEVFAGNRADVSTVQEMVAKVERQHGKAGRIWVMDRGMVSEKTLDLLRAEGRRYIVGTPRGQLRQFEAQLASEEGWQTVTPGLSAKLIAAEEGKEWFILCRSQARGDKEKAMLARFAERIEAGLKKLGAACGGEKKLRQATVERRIGALLSKNSRAKGLFRVQVTRREDGGASMEWERSEKPAKWAALKEGCYLLRTNVEGTVGELWRSYIQLTEAEAAFRIAKSDLRIRPIWHQKQERVGAHILVCFLAYVLWKTLAQMCKGAGLGDEPRKVLDELGGRLRLRVPYDEAELGGVPAETLSFKYYNEESGWWEAIPSQVDTLAHTVSAEVEHLTLFDVGNNKALVPFDFGENWMQGDPMTGEVSLAVPFELPPGPGGLAPDLKLTFSAQASYAAQRASWLAEDAAGYQTASWVGEGFDIPIGYVQTCKDSNSPAGTHRSVNIFGQGARLSDTYTQNGNVLEWQAEDQQFWKIQSAADGNSLTDSSDPQHPVSYRFRVIKPDGTKYFFGTDNTNQQDYFVYWDFANHRQANTKKGLLIIPAGLCQATSVLLLSASPYRAIRQRCSANLPRAVFQ